MSFLRRKSSIGVGRDKPKPGDVLPPLASLNNRDSPTITQTMEKCVLVTSGSGVLGYRVAMSLLEAGHVNVRVGVYNQTKDRADESCGPQCAEMLRSKGAQVVDFDWANTEDYDEALRGVSTVFCTIPHVEGWQDVFPKFVRKCMYKNVEHFIKISFLRPTVHPHRHTSGVTSPDKTCTKNDANNHNAAGISEVALQYRDRVPFCGFHGTCDDYLIAVAKQDDNPMNYTILACSHLMTTPLFLQGDLLRREYKYVTASYGMGVNYVSPNDVADAAVVAILNPKQHYNRVYNLTGPGPTTDKQVAALLTQQFGRPIQHIQLGYNDYVQHVTKERRLPAWKVKDSAATERMKASGADEWPSSYTKDLQNLTGHKPETFANFLKHQAVCMRPGMAFTGTN